MDDVAGRYTGHSLEVMCDAVVKSVPVQNDVSKREEMKQILKFRTILSLVGLIVIW